MELPLEMDRRQFRESEGGRDGGRRATVGDGGNGSDVIKNTKLLPDEMTRKSYSFTLSDWRKGSVDLNLAGQKVLTGSRGPSACW